MKDQAYEIPPHPLGIKPSGNVYGSTKSIKSNAGFFSVLPDELLLHLLEILDYISLRLLSYTCKSLHAFSRLEDLWKAFCIEYVYCRKLLTIALFWNPLEFTMVLHFLRSPIPSPLLSLPLVLATKCWQCFSPAHLFESYRLQSRLYVRTRPFSLR